MKPEQKLIIELLGKVRKSEIEMTLAEKPDWKSFIETASENRIVPLICQNLRPFSAQIPPEIFERLQTHAQSCAMQSLNFNAQLVKLAELLEQNDIEFLAYKGATLAQIAYGDPALRQFGDLDILIHKKDFPAVKKLILENGGRCAWKLSAKQEKAVLKYYYEFPFRIGKNPVLVEIHWAFMESFFGFDYKIEDVFLRKQEVAVRGRNFPTLSHEDLLLVLCVHGAKHFWKRLSWICDVGKLVETQNIEWDLVTRLAEQNGCLRMLLLGLFLAKDWMQADLPAEIQTRIENDIEIRSLAAELKKRLFDKDFSSESSSKNIHKQMRERWRDKFTYSHRLFKTKLIDSLFMPMGRPQ